MKLLYIILISISFSQIFNPETGKLIKADTTKIRFDPITGKKNNSTTNFNNKIFNKTKNKLNIFEIKLMAIGDVDKFFDEEMKTYKFLGGPTSLITILPSSLLGMGIGFLLGGGDEGPLMGLGFLGGMGMSIYGIPRLIANIDSKKPIVLELDSIQSLSPKQRQIYLNEFSRELKRKRVEEIYKGEALTLGFLFVIPLFMGIIFGA